MRKPIQIAALRFDRPDDKPDGRDSIETEIVALCDDGTMWTLFGTDGEWVPLPKIPQGPLLEDWLTDVAAILVEYHVRKDAAERVVDSHYTFLADKYRAGSPASEAAKELADRLK